MAITDAPTANPGAPFASFGYTRDGANLISSRTATGVPADNHKQRRLDDLARGQVRRDPARDGSLPAGALDAAVTRSHPGGVVTFKLQDLKATALRVEPSWYDRHRSVDESKFLSVNLEELLTPRCLLPVA